MGSGLQRIAKLCGGITVTANGETVHYTANTSRPEVGKGETVARDETPAIWQIEDADERHEIATGKAVPFYKFVTKGEQKFYADVVKTRHAKKASLEELVELCDQDAENINAHDFCGTHRLLGAVLFRQLGRKKAEEIMLDIAERRGLHGMSSICGTRDSYADLGVGESGRDWSGTYK